MSRLLDAFCGPGVSVLGMSCSTDRKWGPTSFALFAPTPVVVADEYTVAWEPPPDEYYIGIRLPPA